MTNEAASGTARDPRIARGMARQLASRRRMLETGADAIGWKVALGTPAAQRAAGVEQPVVGFLTSASRLPDGATVPIGGWTKPMVEAEIAVHVAADLGPGADRATAAHAIGGLGAAIEVVDVALPLDAVEEVVAGNIFHRHVVLGPSDPGRRGGAVDGIAVALSVDGAPVARADDPTAVVGDLVEIIRFVADELAASGVRLRAGDVVITGSVTPLHPVAAGQSLRVDAGPLGALELTFSDADGAA